MKNNVIYAYRKNDINKIVYVGQSVDLDTRHKQHIQYDPFNPNTKEYEYPLSRGVRKYGAEAYDLIILEDNISKDDLNDREKYWIKYYDTYWNGYNQTIGGAYPTKPIFTDEKINNVIEMLKDESYSYKDIVEKTGISITHIYNINTGKRRKQDNIEYPIRKSNTKGTKGLKFSPDECEKIHLEILNTNKTFKQIGEKFGCSAEAISDINKGKTKSYRLEKYNYPLRNNPKKIAKINYWENK